MSWRVRSTTKPIDPGDPYYVTAEGACYSESYCKKNGHVFEFATLEAAQKARGLRCGLSGRDPTYYVIMAVSDPVAPAGIKPATNAACFTCHEAFPYDPLPPNRPNGGTDCGRCRAMHEVFG